MNVQRAVERSIAKPDAQSVETPSQDAHTLSEAITILTSKDKPCTKTFELDNGHTVKKNTGFPRLFDVDLKPVGSLGDRAGILTGLEHDLQATIIRGQPFDQPPLSDVRRIGVTFGKAARQWCLIDIDDVPIPDVFENYSEHLVGLVSEAINHLPAEFQGVDCWYQFSSSMGIKEGTIRLHLWFWLSRKVSDEEMKGWLADHPVDLRLYHPVQLHFIAKPIFEGGAVDPLPDRSGVFDGGQGVDTVPVPTDLAERAKAYISRPRHKRSGGVVEHQDIVRDPGTGLAIDGRERLLFDLSNEVTSKLASSNQRKKISAKKIAKRLWKKFKKEADLNDGKWKKKHVKQKAKARYKELTEGTHSFTARGDANTLLPTEGPHYDLNLVSAEEGLARLDEVLDRFFVNAGNRDVPRQVVKITMGAGKTTQTIEKLKDYLGDKSDQLVEVYVPRHDIADEFEERLNEGAGVNARVIHVYPRTGGQIDPNTGETQFEPLCARSDYVRQLEKANYSVYSSACQGKGEGEVCAHFASCDYLDQFRDPASRTHDGNVIRIYQHTHLGFPRNTYEDERQPDLVIVDENFLSSLIDTGRSVSLESIKKHLKTSAHPKMGKRVAKALKKSRPVLKALRDKGVVSRELSRIDLSAIGPGTPFDGSSDSSVNVGSLEEYRNLSLVVQILKQELALEGEREVERLVYDGRKVRICHTKEHRIPDNVPLLILDATANQTLVEKLVGPVDFDQIDIQQRAAVFQVCDHTASNTWWNNNPDQVDRLAQVLNTWVEYGESPLCVSHKALKKELSVRADLNENVQVMNFGGLRGSNVAEGCSVVFITGRNQSPPPEVDYKARALFWDDNQPLHHDDLSENLPLELRGYLQSEHNPRGQSGVMVRSFSDPRIELVHAQEREAETVQAIARLRLVHSTYRKRVFLLGNLPVEIPVDRLLTLYDLMPDVLERELLDTRNLPLTPKGIVKMRPDITTNEKTAGSMLRRSTVTDRETFAKVVPAVTVASVVVATFKAGDKRKTEQSHLFLPNVEKVERGLTVGPVPTPDEIKAFLEGGWGEIGDLKVDIFEPMEEEEGAGGE